MLTVTAPRLDSILGLSDEGFHRVAYAEWGEADWIEEVAVCVHGLTRQGRDFDVLAEALSAHRRVLCPDVVGRGRSDWLRAAEGYGYPQYMRDMAAIVARTGAHAVDWVGTSMGGLIGMMLAAQPNTPIRRLVLNDVGPFIPKAALQRIGEYLGQDPHFESFDDAVGYLRRVHAPFGPLTERQWRHLTEHAVRAEPAGGYRLAYDPKIAAAFADPEAIDDIDLWGLWDRIGCPVLVLRGAESDLLLAETAEEMTRRGPRATLVTFEGVGHAPALMAAEQVDCVVDSLTGTRPGATGR